MSTILFIIFVKIVVSTKGIKIVFSLLSNLIFKLNIFSVALRLPLTFYSLAKWWHLKNVSPTFAQIPYRITNVEFTTARHTIANKMLAVHCLSFTLPFYFI